MLFRNSYESYYGGTFTFQKTISKLKNWNFLQNLVRNPKFILDFENDIEFSLSYFDCYYECYYELRPPVVTKICPYDPGTLGSFLFSLFSKGKAFPLGPESLFPRQNIFFISPVQFFAISSEEILLFCIVWSFFFFFL